MTLRDDSMPAYDADDLSAIDRAFAATWSTIEAHYPGRDPSKDEERKTIVRRKLFALAQAGMIDPEMMRNVALETLPLKMD